MINPMRRKILVSFFTISLFSYPFTAWAKVSLEHLQKEAQELQFIFKEGSEESAYSFERNVTIGGKRPAELRLPLARTSNLPKPLVIVLHGLGITSQLTDLLLGAGRLMDAEDFLLLLPNAAPDSNGVKLWNFQPRSENPPEGTVDDVAYILSLIEEAKAFGADPAQVYVVGYSMGAFLAQRLACDAGQEFKGIVSMAGGLGREPSWCRNNSEKVPRILNIHGTEDTDVPYGGSDYALGPRETTEFWAERANCTGLNSSKKVFKTTFFKWELELKNGRLVIDGNWKDFFKFNLENDTDVDIYNDCSASEKIALWSITGAGHAPIPRLSFFSKVWKFLRE